MLEIIKSDYGNYEIELNKCIKHNNSNAMKGQRLLNGAFSLTIENNKKNK